MRPHYCQPTLQLPGMPAGLFVGLFNLFLPFFCPLLLCFFQLLLLLNLSSTSFPSPKPLLLYNFYFQFIFLHFLLFLPLFCPCPSNPFSYSTVSYSSSSSANYSSSIPFPSSYTLHLSFLSFLMPPLPLVTSPPLHPVKFLLLHPIYLPIPC